MSEGRKPQPLCAMPAGIKILEALRGGRAWDDARISTIGMHTGHAHKRVRSRLSALEGLSGVVAVGGRDSLAEGHRHRRDAQWRAWAGRIECPC